MSAIYKHTIHKNKAAKPEPKPDRHWISCADSIGLRRATGFVDLAWLVRVASPKPESHAREMDVEEATEGEGQQRCSPSQVEAGWAGPFHQSPWKL